MDKNRREFLQQSVFTLAAAAISSSIFKPAFSILG